jgi:hypothetical protein
VKFLDGSTVAQLDTSAAALAKLIGERGSGETPGPFTDMAGAKRRRKQELAAIFTGRAQHRRDDQGRFTANFSGGARESVPLPPPTHEETLLELLATRAADSARRI